MKTHTNTRLGDHTPEITAAERSTSSMQGDVMIAAKLSGPKMGSNELEYIDCD